MNVLFFCHSLLSDWNHGNAHFLRGIARELQARGHAVKAFEPVDAWSVENLIAEAGAWRLNELRSYYPTLEIERYDPANLDPDQATAGADLVIVHEWNAPELVARLGRQRARGARHRLLFHDTHHRSVSDEGAIGALDLSGYDGVLAFGEAVRQRYVQAGWARRAWTWHEAADTRLARPLPELERTQDLVWIGNWGDEERSQELEEFLLAPAAALGLSGTVYGVRYPREGLEGLARAGLEFGGWLPNYLVPEVFARHRLTVHVPRRPYVRALPGIPTIRVFEALASGIPLISAHFHDVEGLFRADDFLRVSNGDEMRDALRLLSNEPDAARELAERGLRTVLERHTTAHRAAELMAICEELGVDGARSHSLAYSGVEARAWD